MLETAPRQTCFILTAVQEEAHSVFLLPLPVVPTEERIEVLRIVPVEEEEEERMRETPSCSLLLLPVKPMSWGVEVGAKQTRIVVVAFRIPHFLRSAGQGQAHEEEVVAGEEEEEGDGVVTPD